MSRKSNPLDYREIPFDSPLDFRLSLDATEDGERISTERQQQEENRRRNEARQRSLFDAIHIAIEKATP